MMKLIPIQYHVRQYPLGINPRIQELAANMDTKVIKPTKAYSLHTEYSYMKREFETPLIRQFPALISAHDQNVPKLWYSEEWSQQFAGFIQCMVGDNPPPTIIEIHPPFNDYCLDMDTFIFRYRIFEENIQRAYPGVKILIENRSGTMYRGGKFLVSEVTSLKHLCRSIQDAGLSLQLVLDVPQLFTAHGIHPDRDDPLRMCGLLNMLMPIRHHIAGLHLWGKRKGKTGRTLSHVGNLKSWLGFRADAHALVLEKLAELCDDGVPRYFVPEVNSHDQDLHDIVEDMKAVGFRFVRG